MGRIGYGEIILFLLILVVPSTIAFVFGFLFGRSVGVNAGRREADRVAARGPVANR